MAEFDPYTNDEGVLINKFGIIDKTLLFKVEAEKAMLRLSELYQNPIEGKYDFVHLSKIHKYIFGDVYSWAGETRNCDIAKFDLYCKPQYFESYSEPFFENLRKENYFRGLSQDDFCNKATVLMGNLYSTHFFREGNTRSLCEYMRELAQDAGYELNFGKIPYEQLRDSCFSSVRGNLELLHKSIGQCLGPLDDAIKFKREKINMIKSYRDWDSIKPTTSTEYIYQAQQIIKEYNRWPGEEADRRIAKILAEQGRNTADISRAIINNSPEIAYQSMSVAVDYVKDKLSNIKINNSLSMKF
jgi:cell filamentation protein